jgi:hypothetical protein
MSLENEIKTLIESKREGQHWDFKEKYPENNASLLHDVICLANALHKGKKYLIFGVSDPKTGCKLHGVSGDTNRKSQAELIDFLRSKSFAGDIRPEVELRTVEINEVEIDVLIIFDNPQKPYYLKKDYQVKDKNVRANYIYTRNGDTNTAINESADIGGIEKMWRERFGLDVLPLEKLRIYLLDFENWKWDGIDSAYYELLPEFTIKVLSSKERQDKSVWWDGFPWGENLSECNYWFYYHTTLLAELTVIHCMREDFSFPYPDVDCIKTDNENDYATAENTYSFFYYQKNSLTYSLLHHLFMGKPMPVQSFTKPTDKKLPFIQFENEDLKENFKVVLNKHLSAFFRQYPKFPRKELGTNMLEEEEKFAYWSYDLYSSLNS